MILLLLAAISTDCVPALKLGTSVPTFSTNLRTMFQDRDGIYWFGSDGEGVSRYDGKSIVRFTAKDGLAGNLVGEIHQDKKGNLYFGTSGGISKFDGQRFTTLTSVIMDSPEKGWRLHPDDIWFLRGTTDGGPSRYDGKTLYSLRFPKNPLREMKVTPNPGLTMYSLYTIYKDKRGHMWFGTGNDGLCRYDGKSINWMYESHLSNVPAGGSFGIRSIIEDREGKLWVCNTKYRFNVSPKNTPEHGTLKYVSEPGTEDLTTRLSQDRLYFQAVAKGKEGDLWMMPWGGGIFRYDGKKITHYPVKDGDKDALMSFIYKDRQGALWICSQTGGPYRFNGTSFEKFAPATE